MMWNNCLRCLPFTILLVAVASAGESDPPPAVTKAASEEQIARLIARLGSDDFAVRERASRRLQELDEALPALRQARKSSDAEVRRRAGEIIAVLETRLAERFIRQAVARVNEEGLDLFLDRMVLQKEYATEARWKAAVQLARALAKRAAEKGATVPKIVDRDFVRLPEAATIGPGICNGVRVRVEGVDRILNLHGCLFFSSGSLQGVNSTDGSILFVNGDIRSMNSTTNSIIICNGTIKSFNYTKDCVIFCNGVVESMNSTTNSAVFVRGELRGLNHTVSNVIEATKLGRGNLSQNNTYLNCKAPPGRPGQGDKCVSADPSCLTLFRFFEPARAGLEFTMVDGDARIDKVVEGKPFARAGLRKDDRVIAMDRVKFLSEDAFIRMLRRKIVAGKALFRLQRGDRVLEVPVPFEP